MITIMTNYLLLAATSADDTSVGISFLVVLGLGFFCYILPGIIANKRNHHNSGAIWCLTIFLGWTFLGWVIALVWAFTNPPTQQVVINNGRLQP